MNFATSVTDPDPRIRTLDYGSGSGSSYVSSSGSDPAIFVSDLQDANKKYFYFLNIFSVGVHLHQSSKITSLPKTNNLLNFYHFGQFLRSVLDSLRIQ
jgi:hypothetical protein